jgi:predicted TIM-barrel fold metal-dependent hydrolase
MQRAITELGFRGVEMFTDINGKPLDAPESLPLFEQMERFDLPILLHPRRTNTTPDYANEQRSRFLAYPNFGWPFETSLAMLIWPSAACSTAFPS